MSYFSALFPAAHDDQLILSINVIFSLLGSLLGSIRGKPGPRVADLSALLDSSSLMAQVWGRVDVTSIPYNCTITETILNKFSLSSLVALGRGPQSATDEVANVVSIC